MSFRPLCRVLVLALFVATASAIFSSVQTREVHADDATTGTITVTPASGTFNVGDTFTANVQVSTTATSGFNLVTFDMGVSKNLTVLATASPLTQAACNTPLQQLVIITQIISPNFSENLYQVSLHGRGFQSPDSNISFMSCTIVSLSLQANAPGPAGISIENPVLEYEPGITTCPNSSNCVTVDLLTGSTGASYTIYGPTTGTMSFYPFSGTYQVGQTFQTTLYLNGNGQAITGANATVTIPNPNLQVVSILPGNCPNVMTPTTLSFGVSFAPPSSIIQQPPIMSCQLYTLVLRVNNNRINLPGQVSITNGHLINAAGQDILKSALNASFTLTP